MPVRARARRLTPAALCGWFGKRGQSDVRLQLNLLLTAVTTEERQRALHGGRRFTPYPTGPAARIFSDTELNFSKFLWKRAASSLAAWS